MLEEVTVQGHPAGGLGLLCPGQWSFLQALWCLKSLSPPPQPILPPHPQTAEIDTYHLLVLTSPGWLGGRHRCGSHL